MLVFSARLAKQSLANSSVSGRFEDGWHIAHAYFKEISSCADLASKMIAAHQPGPPDLADLHREYTSTGLGTLLTQLTRVPSSLAT